MPTVVAERLGRLKRFTVGFLAYAGFHGFEPILCNIGRGKHTHGRGVHALQRLLRMVREYPRKPLLEVIQDAQHFGLYDLDRIERMILRRVDHDYFTAPDFDQGSLPTNEDDDDEG